MDKIEKKQIKKNLVKFLNATENVDKKMIDECLKYYNLSNVDYNDKICLDLGANVGGFTKIALDRGAKKVIAVECDKRNYDKLWNSFNNDDRVIVIYGAITNIEGKIKIFKSNSKQNHCSTSIIKKNVFKEYDEVDSINLEFLLEKFNPNIVKIDIEGAEYQIMEHIYKYLPEVLFIELHTGSLKEYTQPTIDKLSTLYNENNIVEEIVYGKVCTYNCFFKK